MASDGEFEDDFYDNPPAMPVSTLALSIASIDKPTELLPSTKEPIISQPLSLFPPVTSEAQVELTAQALSTSETNHIPDSFSISGHQGSELGSIGPTSVDSEDTVQQDGTAIGVGEGVISQSKDAKRTAEENDSKGTVRQDNTSVEDALALKAESTEAHPAPEEVKQEIQEENTKAIRAGPSPPSARMKADPEFLELAQTNNENPEAEWRYDTSDAESSSSSSSSSSSDSSSDDDSDDENLLNAEEQMRILMEGMDEDGEDGGGRRGARGEEEKPEPIIPKPDLVVTEDMAIVELGDVETAMGQHILIKAKTTGTYRVLDQGSALCLADRTVIGAINDLLGKVVQPYYVVGFETAEELSDSGITAGTTIYYVLDHAEFALVQPLMEQKHYDTNAGDEKNGEEDVEFSDDEKEAAYKASLKAKKRERYEDNSNSRSKRPAQRPRHSGIGTASTQPTAYPTQIRYDEEDYGDDLYVPLARPDNLHNMMASGAPPPIEGRHNVGHRGGRSSNPRDRDGNHNDDHRFSPRGRGRGNDRRGGRGHGGNRGGGFKNSQRGSDDRGNMGYDNSRQGASGNNNYNDDLPFRATGRSDPSYMGQQAFPPPPMPNHQQPPFQQPGHYAEQQQPVQSMNTYAFNGVPAQNGSFNIPHNFPVQGTPNGYPGMPYTPSGMNGPIPIPLAQSLPTAPNQGDHLVAAFQQQFNQFRATFSQQFGNTPPANIVSPPQQLHGYAPPPPPQQPSRDPRLQARQGTANAFTAATAAPATGPPPAANSGAALEELLRNINSGGQT